MAENLSLWTFAQAFRQHVLAAMSGSFSVPFTAAAVFSDSKYGQSIFGLLAFCSAWFAAFTIWKAERQKVIELEEKQSPSKKQAAVDELSHELEWAVHNLYNRSPLPEDGGYWRTASIAALTTEIDAWDKRIADKLKNREVFTESDGIHFSVLGVVEPFLMTGVQDVDRQLAMLSLKFDRLRDIIARRHP
jgi:hypothetical protein